MAVDPVVMCGCGRRMTVDALRGAGAFRCGCGARVGIRLPEPPVVCGWRPRGEAACRSVVVRTDDPIPLCRDHHKAFRALWFPEESDLRRYNRLGLICDCTPMPEVDVEQYAAQMEQDIHEARYPPPVVYYARRDALVKIGTTTNLQQRMIDLDVDELLATEPGGRDLEANRHYQFRHLLARKREWFAAGPDLLAHIEQLKAAVR